MSEIEVRELNSEDYTEWDDLVESSPQGTVFHRIDWLTTYKGLLNLKIFGFFKKRQLVGGCILNVHEKSFLKSAANFGIEQVVVPYEGVIFRKIPEKTKVRAAEAFYRDSCDALLNFLSSQGFHFVRLVNSPGVIDIRPFTSAAWNSEVRYTYYLNLQTANLESFSRDVRRNIKKALTYGITIEKSYDHSTFLELYLQMLTRKNQLIASRLMGKVFERIIPQLDSKGLGEMWIAKSNSGQAISGEIILFDKKRAYGWLAATHSDYLHTGASSLLRYRIIQELQEKGLREIDLVGADGWGTSEFKAGFNPRIMPYYIVKKSSFTHKVASTLNKIGSRMF